LLLVACLLSPVSCLVIEAAVSQGDGENVESSGFSQSGPGANSSNFRQRQLTVGGPLSSSITRSSRFRIVPGLFSVPSGGGPPLVDELDITVLYAKTEPFGVEIPAQTWQLDKDPIFIWEPPPTGPDVAGYSYALDGTADGRLKLQGDARDEFEGPAGELVGGHAV
jgi:hypothetical protein